MSPPNPAAQHASMPRHAQAIPFSHKHVASVLLPSGGGAVAACHAKRGNFFMAPARTRRQIHELPFSFIDCVRSFLHERSTFPLLR